MTVESLPLAIAGVLVSRRHRRRYTGRRRPDTIQPAPADHLLSPAAYQLVTGTTQQVPADVDQPTGLYLNPAAVRAHAREVTR